MANVSTKLPSPNSRRKPDPSNKPLGPQVEMDISPDGGFAVCDLNQQVVINGTPRCQLSGSGHAAPLYPIGIAQNNLASFTLAFAEPVVDGDVITWPERDEAIRGRIGGYVAPLSYIAGPPVVLGPYPTSINYNASTNLLEVNFSETVEAGATSPAGLIRFRTTDGVTFTSEAIDSIIGTTVFFTAVWQSNMLMIATSTAVGIGAAIQAVGGGAPAQDWTAFEVTQTDGGATPFLVHAEWNAAATRVSLYWQMTVINNISGVNVRADDGINKRLGSHAGVQPNGALITVVCATIIGVSDTPNTTDVDAAAVVGLQSGNPNDAIVDYAMPTVP